MTTAPSTRRAFREGRFLEARQLLNVSGAHSLDDRILGAEVDYFLGHSSSAVKDAEAILRDDRAPSAIQARCLVLLASRDHDVGDIQKSLGRCAQALAAAQTARDPLLISATLCQFLERSCDHSGFDAALPLAAQTRKAAARCGDPQSLALVHLTFGRLEARVGHLEIALRHFRVGRGTLSADPNESLLAALDVDEGGVLSLLGDAQSALELTQRGAATAARAGWSKVMLVAATNLAYLFASIGALDKAEAQLSIAKGQVFRNISYDLALADTRARIHICRGEYGAAEAVLIEAEKRSEQVPGWYSLSIKHTHARLLLRQSRWQEVLEVAQEGLQTAERYGAKLFSASLRMTLAEALLNLGMSMAAPLPIDDRPVDWSLPLIGSLYLLNARALLVSRADSERATKQLNRAVRLLESAVDKTTELDARDAVAKLSGAAEQEPHDRQNREARADLDSAVAILELAGHPHILAREAFALLQETDCAERAALLAGTGPTLRVIDTHHWTADEALAVARAVAPSDLITVGLHRQEPWQILTRPRPDLDHRCTLAAIRKLVDTAATLDRYRRDEKQRAALWPAEALDGDPESLWASEQSAELLTIGRRIAAAPLPILLTGETGTGKEMLARAIHRASDRADRPMVPFNCTAVPRDMLESQLFGYRKGAFTGADASFPGVIRAAAGGTLFLDEIGDMGLDVQPKILRFLENQEIHPLGEPHPVKADVRIIAATNGNLDELVAQGRFREDLFYRLNVVRLNLPPLRERREEIPPLVQHYIRRHGDELRKGRLTLSDETLEYLLLYSWPGNIRQLANEVRRMVALAEVDSTLTPALLSPEIQASRRTIPAAPDAGAEIRIRLDQPLPAAIDFLEQIMVRRALEQTKGRVEEASRVLGISRKGLFLKRRRMGLRQLA